jgi:hypothetical protein
MTLEILKILLPENPVVRVEHKEEMEDVLPHKWCGFLKHRNYTDEPIGSAPCKTKAGQSREKENFLSKKIVSKKLYFCTPQIISVFNE